MNVRAAKSPPKYVFRVHLVLCAVELRTGLVLLSLGENRNTV